MNPSLFSLDIVEIIVDALASKEDIEDLTNCSLVSHTFARASRKHIFSQIQFRGQRSGGRVHSLIRLIKSNPSLARLIRTAHIDDGDTCELTNERRWSLALDVNLPRLFRMFSRLHSLTIKRTFRAIHWDTCSIELRDSIAYLLRSGQLSSLKLYDFRGLPLSLFIGCPGLKHLTLCRCRLESDLALSDSTVLVQNSESEFSETRLESLSFGQANDAVVSLAEASVQPGASFNLSCLCKLNVTEGRVERSALDVAWEKIAPCASRTLENLTYTMRDSFTPASFDLNALPALKFLTFITPGSFPNPRSFEVICKVLEETKRGNKLQTIVIEGHSILVDNSFSGQRKFILCEQLDTILAGAEMESLRLVVLKVEFSVALYNIRFPNAQKTDVCMEMSELIRAHFPRLSSATSPELRIIIDFRFPKLR